jgi:hypothetical protein
MGYTVTFYAMDGQRLARDMRDAPSDVLGKIESRLRERAPSEGTATRGVLDAAARLCRGDLPPDCDLEYFCALCWLAEVTAERVTICSFQDFRHLSYLEEIGIWPWMQRRPPPFPVPRCQDESPQVGFLSVNDIETFALPEFARLPRSDDRDVLNARDEFRDVLESLVPDQLDLLGVLL